MKEIAILQLPVQIKKETYLRILPVYLKELNETNKALKASFVKHNWNEMHALIHKLKGSAANYGAKQLEKKAAEIQQKRYLQSELNQSELDELTALIGLTIQQAEQLLKEN